MLNKKRLKTCDQYKKHVEKITCIYVFVMCIYIYQNSWVNNVQFYSEQFKKYHLNFSASQFSIFYFSPLGQRRKSQINLQKLLPVRKNTRRNFQGKQRRKRLNKKGGLKDIGKNSVDTSYLS